ncbi:uncharacterized protein KY384_006218 [Bacidia gigantensis]|uniref:uncharacterized protein n=1 Tax=Bacidia gigantensis TaxID=2732470 RepID=UPI001D03EA4E|nr:uncharacterized protein KY384_006218 [Bacidia gigantensis]KAG8529581.1 hypothetical protein KY384_006218 [Bacidia gigantensis]
MTALKGSHTAGIYADMTVDGPEIGTLVVIIDRAKNLPNRKTMGKQDPYCAARLGKEAKKTETDKRGGQTPRWDQELRFTVHDSPDYYKLKVSVFNDDKKTELIGEVWLGLEDIVVRGGGQNDLWHTLSCKGRYAGDIRIELTYYDTRPKDNKVEDRRQSTPTEDTPEAPREGLSGPRQPRPMKRRPLPRNPTEATPPSSHPQTPQSMHHEQPPIPQQRHVESPDDYQFYTPPQQPQHHQYQEQSRNDLPDIDDGYSAHQGYSPQQYSLPPLPVRSSPLHQVNPQPPQNLYHDELEDNVYPPQMPQHHHHRQPYAEEEDDSATHSYIEDRTTLPQQGLPRPQPQRYHQVQKQLPITPHGTVSSQQQRPTNSVDSYGTYVSSPPSSLRHESPETWSDQGNGLDDDDGPPPPPTHRESSSRSLPQTPQNSDLRGYASAPAPSPLQARNQRTSISHSPLSQVHTVQANPAGMLSTSPSPYEHSHHSNSASSRHSLPQNRQRQTHPPVRESMPSSLVAGYEARATPDEESVSSDPRHIEPHPHFLQQIPREQQMSEPVLPTQRQVLAQRQVPLNAIRPGLDPRGHRNSVPVPGMRPGISNPDLRTPKRKSVSIQQPGSAPHERPQSDLPFSPDSFNTFNPQIDSANTINQAGPAYTTPDQAREAAVQHDRDLQRGDGPIIGNDGRVIDPSDHLPADTWAPEPEQKAPKRGPEVTLRFKHSPQSSARPMPQPAAARRAPLAEARPNALPMQHPTMPQQTQSYSADNSPVSSSARARLQKKSRVGMGMGAPNSSPVVPTLETAAAAPRQFPTMPRHSASDYPIRERENYGFMGGSPTYGGDGRSPGGSGGGRAPPVPMKVPIGSGQEDWGNPADRALSEELRGIDIGVSPHSHVGSGGAQAGGGSGHKARVRRFGF